MTTLEKRIVKFLQRHQPLEFTILDMCRHLDLGSAPRQLHLLRLSMKTLCEQKLVVRGGLSDTNRLYSYGIENNSALLVGP